MKIRIVNMKRGLVCGDPEGPEAACLFQAPSARLRFEPALRDKKQNNACCFAGPRAALRAPVFSSRKDGPGAVYANPGAIYIDSFSVLLYTIIL